MPTENAHGGSSDFRPRRLARKIRAGVYAQSEMSFGRIARRGSALWLAERERRYGGKIVDVPRRRVSPDDPRDSSMVASGGMTGGDRFSREHNAYGPAYARHLRRFLSSTAPVVVEVGVLKGTGLAVWCDLFPTGTILGLDIDPSLFNYEYPKLRRRRAFELNSPTVLEFDAYRPDTSVLEENLKGRRIDVIIDDGPHTIEAIVRTASALKRFLSDDYVYFVEDNRNAAEAMRETLSSPFVDVDQSGLVTSFA